MMEYNNIQTNNLKSHWAQQMIENMNSQTSFLEEQRESLPSSCHKEAQEKKRGAYTSELMRRRTWPQLFRKGWHLLFDFSQRQHKDPGMRQREIHSGEISEKDREARSIYGNSCEISKEDTRDNKHSQVLRCGTEIKQQATTLKTGLPRDDLFPEEKELQRLARRDIFTSLEILGTGPRMTMFETYHHHLRPCTEDLKQSENAKRQKKAFKSCVRSMFAKGRGWIPVFAGMTNKGTGKKSSIVHNRHGPARDRCEVSGNEKALFLVLSLEKRKRTERLLERNNPFSDKLRLLPCHPRTGGDPEEAVGNESADIGKDIMRPSFLCHPRSCTENLRQSGDGHRCQKNAFIRDRHGIKNQESLSVPAHSPCHSPKEENLWQPRSSKKHQEILSSLRDTPEEKNNKMKACCKKYAPFSCPPTKSLPRSTFSHMIERRETSMTFLRFLSVCIIFCLEVCAQGNPPPKETLLNGWYLWDPYQYAIRNEGAGDTLTGLDIELVKAITTAAKYKVVYEPISWKQHQEDLKKGKRDFAAGATYTKERAQFVHFSAPYRFEENSLFVRRNEESRLQFKTIPEFLDQIKQHRFRLGIIEGYIYADPAINKWLADPQNQKLIVKANNDLENINSLLDGKIDGFLADRIVGATLIWRTNHGPTINEIRLGIKTPIHFMFSKKTVPLTQVEEFNKAIEKVKESSAYNQIISWYLHPVLLLQTIDTNWFHFIEIMGTIAFAISGLVIAYQKRATLFGAFLLAVLPSLGGGIIRDVIFNRKPVGALQSPLYLSLVLATVLIGFPAVHLYAYWQKKKISAKAPSSYKSSHVAENILAICDAMGLAAFTITGIVVSVMAKVTPLWLWGAFFAFLTGAGGGILRDLISGSKDVVSLRGGIYPEIAIFWGFSLSIFLMWQTNDINPEAIKYGVMLHVAGAFLTRLIVYFLKIPNIYFRNEEISSHT